MLDKNHHNSGVSQGKTFFFPDTFPLLKPIDRLDLEVVGDTSYLHVHSTPNKDAGSVSKVFAETISLFIVLIKFHV